MNLSDDKSDNLFSDKYNDDDFFKDGAGNDLLKNESKPLKLDESYSRSQDIQDDYSDVSKPSPVKNSNPAPVRTGNKDAPRFDYLNYGKD